MKRDDPFKTPPIGDTVSRTANKSQPPKDEVDSAASTTSALPARGDDPFADDTGNSITADHLPPPPVLDQCLTGSSTAATKPQILNISGEDLSKLAGRQQCNLLNAAAVNLFGIINQLRNSSALLEITELHRRMIAAVNGFEHQACAYGYETAIVQTARYCLCTAIDEAALSSEWAIDSAWASHSLLYTFFSDTSGGETFFTKLDEVRASIAASRHDDEVGAKVDLLEVLYICLALGFSGKYRIVDDGETKLDQLRQSVYELIKEKRGAGAPELSPNWRGAEIADQARGFLPVWLTALITLAVLLGMFIMVSHNLNLRSDQSFAQIQSIGRTIAFDFDRQTPKVGKAQEWWRGFDAFLDDEISRNVLELIDTPEAIVIRIFNNGLFGSASAVISNDYQRVFERIGQAIERRVPGAVMVVGHSDNLPIRSVRFPSNWHLSTARADAVAKAILPSLSEPGRLSFEGRSDTEPLASNATPEGQTANRRVEILLPKVVAMADAMPAPSEDPYWPDQQQLRRDGGDLKSN